MDVIDDAEKNDEFKNYQAEYYKKFFSPPLAKQISTNWQVGMKIWWMFRVCFKTELKISKNKIHLKVISEIIIFI